jgi:hypothetical protein
MGAAASRRVAARPDAADEAPKEAPLTWTNSPGARRAQDLTTAAVLPDRRPERRRRLAEPDLKFRAFCTRRRLPASSTPQLEPVWDAWQAERYQRGEIDQRPGYTGNPFRPR